ncbi:maleylpyruvate isomerase family mycothiol-dependent enzyme [Kribbella sp. NBC_01245]|uniref:maleylpyruvate isomerase family mycothiol-dependent enzyme n=1 Tax=Kribbella sp. NBC_01245 TaxID=2903578 RepID=UPI002E2BA51E|nr:maleylpyruvate isomerase family mycothiol-dependent enzyme [Kribbella sp. NBC_01245]
MPEPDLDYPELLAGAVRDMAAALALADPDAPVPSCPGWTVVDLAEHIVSVHQWATKIVSTGEFQRPLDVRRTGLLSDWYAETGQALVSTMRAARPEAPCWNFAPVPQVAGFWPRRQLHETTIHTVDVLQTAGRPPAIEARVAADGVDEAFRVFLPRMLVRGFPPAVTEPVTVVSTDTDDVWTLTPVDGQAPRVDASRGEALATISAPARDLYLALWKRASFDSLAIAGDAQVAAGFLTGRITP